MWILTPASTDCLLINLLDFELLDILPHVDGDYALMAFVEDHHSPDCVCIKKGKYEELYSLMYAIGTVGRCSKYAPTTPTFH